MKARVTITLDRALLRSVEQRARGRSRSEAIEEALRAAERLAIARETIAYYQSMTPNERSEEAEWGEVAALGAAARDEQRATGHGKRGR
jgi:metal-responsive CopG/Arc/MetJ family transcriptional regulator